MVLKFCLAQNQCEEQKFCCLSCFYEDGPGLVQISPNGRINTEAHTPEQILQTQLIFYRVQEL